MRGVRPGMPLRHPSGLRGARSGSRLRGGGEQTPLAPKAKFARESPTESLKKDKRDGASGAATSSILTSETPYSRLLSSKKPKEKEKLTSAPTIASNDCMGSGGVGGAGISKALFKRDSTDHTEEKPDCGTSTESDAAECTGMATSENLSRCSRDSLPSDVKDGDQVIDYGGNPTQSEACKTPCGKTGPVEDAGLTPSPSSTITMSPDSRAGSTRSAAKSRSLSSKYASADRKPGIPKQGEAAFPIEFVVSVF